MATSEPKSETAAPEGYDSMSNPEPLPKWSTAFDEWDSWWEVHTYGFGCVFAVLALFCVFCLFRLRISRTLTLARYFTAVIALLLVFSSTRALYLLLDPYEAHKSIKLPVVLVRIIFALGYPCLTSIFSLVNFAFLKVNNVWLVVQRLQSLEFLCCVIGLHFLIVLAVYLIVTFAPRFARLFILCQSILIVWWILLVVFFLYSAWLVSWNEKIKTKYINRNSTIVEGEKEDIESASNGKSNRDVTTRKGTNRIIRISGLVAIAGLVSVVLELYSLFGVYDLYSLENNVVKAWPWWGYQTGQRAVELFLCCIVAYVVYPTIKKRENNATGNSLTTMSQSNRRINIVNAAPDPAKKVGEVYL